MKIAAIYARVSSTRQQLNENIGSQLEALLDHAKAHDYQVSPQHIFQDDGHSEAALTLIAPHLSGYAIRSQPENLKPCSS